PLVAGDRLCAAGGYGTAGVLCLATGTGQALWGTPCDLAGFGSRALGEAGRLFVGLGAGKLNRSAAQPVGALLCLDAATGRQLWRYDVGDSVCAAPAVAGQRVYFGARDRHCYALDQQ